MNTQDVPPVSIQALKPFTTACRSRSTGPMPLQATEVFSSTGKFAGIFSKTRPSADSPTFENAAVAPMSRGGRS